MQYQPLPKRSYWQTQQHTTFVVGVALAFTSLAALIGWEYAHSLGIIIGIASALIIQSVVWAAINRVPLWLCQPYNIRRCEQSELLHIIDTLALRTGVSVPRVYEIQVAAPNIFTFGTSPNSSVIVVTSGLMQWLSKEELVGVVAHEMAHIKYRNTALSGLGIVLSAVVLGPLHIYSKRFLTWTTPSTGFTNNLRIFNQYTNIMASKITRLWRSNLDKLHADAFGATILTNPLDLISALEKIEWATQRMDFEIHPSIAPLFVVEPGNNTGNIHAITERITHLRRLSRLSTNHSGTHSAPPQNPQSFT